MRHPGWLAVILCILGSSSRVVFAEVSCDVPVATSAGLVQGSADRDRPTCSWKGVPYAAPPVDARRWRRPEPPVTWQGVRAATRFAPRCMQRGVMEYINHDPSGRMSEDCLTVNIWRPRTEGAHPVMVWFHGGGLYGGTANTPAYHGDRLAAAGDVVVVTVNYRLDIFGFLANEALVAEDPDGSAGNYGLLDEVQALRWVRENIAAFGGDPGRVTLMGESAGGWSVCNLLATPLAAGLFQGAILESGGCQAVTDMARGFELGRRVARDVECAPGDLACLRAVPAKRLMRKAMRSEVQGFEWLPRVDGYALKRRPIDAIAAGEFNNVPFIAGANRNEADGAVLILPKLFFGASKSYGKRLGDAFGPDSAERLARLYPLDDLGSPRAAYERLYTDAALFCPTLNGLMAVAEKQPSSWFYRFDYHDFHFGWMLGALHGSEIPFVFDAHDRQPFAMIYSRWARKRAAALTATMMGYWTRFAWTGNPNGPGLPAWKPFGTERVVQVLDAKVSSEQVTPALADRCGHWGEHVVSHPWMVETFGLLGTRPGRTRVWPTAPSSPPELVVQPASIPGGPAAAPDAAGRAEMNEPPASMATATTSAADAAAAATASAADAASAAPVAAQPASWPEAGQSVSAPASSSGAAE